ncbi:MAG: hypothetical protein KDC46_14945, partial [Thermoleophilia bacterium]|nr:hypothetical protein [Thermoleophilia bacterium]
MVANSPGILPKTALVASRAVYYPFTIPQKLNDSATLTGAALNGMVKGVNASIGNAYMALQPRGPAKWLAPLFAKVDAATTKSDAIAQRNKTVFWDPFSQGVEGVGRAIASPGTYWYLRKAGVEQPTQDMIKGVLNMPLFSFPEAPPGGGGGDAGGDAAAAAEAAAAAQQQAAAQQ